MSTLKVDGIRSNSASSDAITLASDGTCTANITNNLSNRNLIINGAMQVAQRGTSFTGANATWTLDRWRSYENLSTAVVDVTQETITDLTGFTKALKINTTTAETGVPSGSGNKYCTLFQGIEAQNLQHIANGASGAKSLTLSFWVKSNVTGQFTANLYKPDNTTRLISKAYTINSANTWEKKTITFSGDTAGGGIVNDNGGGIYLYFIWGRNTGYTGGTSTSWVNYSDAAWAPLCTGTLFENVNDHVLLTGVQLEVDNGSEKPTDFEHRSYGQELALCQRYYQLLVPRDSGENPIGMFYTNSNTMFCHVALKTTMRATPTLDVSNYTNAFRAYGSSGVNHSTVQLNTGCTDTMLLQATGDSGTAGYLRVFNQDGGLRAKIAANAEI